MNRIDLKITHQCNNRCKFCVQGDKRRVLPDMKSSHVKKILTESRRAYGGVVFTGGEVTIRQDIFELVKFAKNLGFKVQIQSNGRMFAYRDFCLKMIEAGAREFALALHGHIGELHDFLTSSPGSFEQTLGGIKNLIALGKVVITNTVITKSNYRFLPDVARLLSGLGVRQIQFAFPHLVGNAGENYGSIAPRKSLVEPFVKTALDIGSAAGARMYTEAIPYCFLKGHGHFIAERCIPQTKIFDLDRVVDDYTVVRRTEGKAKGPDCPHCVYDVPCEGPWKEYPNLFGWKEFKPIACKEITKHRKGK